MKTKYNFLQYLFCLLFFQFFVAKTFAQDITIELGPDEIALNEPFTIMITVKDSKIRNYSNFPDIPGFIKQGVSSSSSTSIINGRVNSEHSYTQSYVAQKEGTYQLKPFTMSVNGKDISSSGKTITVGPPKQHNRQRTNPFGRDPFEEFRDNFFGDNEQQEFVEIEDKAFLGLTVDKEEVYVGEGFTTTLAFYIAEDNRATLSFFDLGNQLSKLIKTLKPNNAWEENFDIKNVKREDVTLNGKRYSQYKLYEARFYPLNAEDIKLPSTSLKMIKYKVAKRSSFFGNSRKEDYKVYHTQPKTVRVKELPPHPLKDKVAVGNYQLNEQISSKQLEAGNSFSYIFSIVGQGNIAAINKPEPQSSDEFTIYEPNVSQNTRKQDGKLIGVKQFSYYAIPNEPGQYNLGDYFYWIYFNPTIAAYDTLRSRIKVDVTGESQKNKVISSNDVGSFYDRIEAESNVLVNLTDDGTLKLLVNIFILIMLAATAVIIFKK